MQILKSRKNKKYTAKTDMKRNDNEYHESCFALSISKLETQNFYPNPTRIQPSIDFCYPDPT